MDNLFNELENSIKKMDKKLKEYEEIALIQNYKELLMKKEYLLCEYTFLLTENNAINNMKQNIVNKEKENKR